MVDLERLFYPKNICLIGVSNLPIKGATAHFYALRKLGFDKPIYCVNRNRDKVMLDTKAYPSILDVPEDEIDYVIVGVPRNDVPNVIEDCVKKHVKFGTIFTSGFSEMGTEYGQNLEHKMVDIARKNDMRLIGPNCLGPFCRDSKVTMTEILELADIDIEDRTAFISQSGGHTGSFFEIGENRGFPFNKVISIGNQCDLKIQDFIEYFLTDPKIDVISCYIEEVKDQDEFLRILDEASRKKPVIFWKGGRTKEGTIAAASHTGAISSSYRIFKSAIEQHGGIMTTSIEELSDLTLGSLYLAQKEIGERIAIMVPGGGSCVEMTDQTVSFGLKVPVLEDKTREEIQKNIQEINTCTRNPVDLGVFGWLPRVYSDILTIISRDPKIDLVFFYFMIERLPGFIDRMQDRGLGRSFIRSIRRAVRKSNKPFIGIIPQFNINNVEITKHRNYFVNELCKLGVPYFESMSRAANVISKILKYKNWVKNKE